MNNMSTIKKSMLTAVCIALCVVLPQAFHAIPNAGSIYLPMHIPVLLCGLICGWRYGLLCGLAGPLLSSLITGMPMAPYLAPMMIECAVYGLVSGFMMKIICTGKIYADLYICLMTAMLAGRIVAGIAKAFLFMPGEYGMAAWTLGSFVTGFPGIVIQLVILPNLVFSLIKAKLIPARYRKEE